MAIDYDGSPNGLFVRLGKIIKNINTLETLSDSTLDSYREDILDTYYATTGTVQEGARRAVEGLSGSMDSMIQSVLSWRRTLSNYGTNTLLDDDNVLSQLNLPSTASISRCLMALIEQMNTDTETVNQSSVTVPAGATAPDTGSGGTGRLFCDKVLDGVTAPHYRYPASLEYLNVNSELAVNETMILTCVADSQHSGTQEGQERFSWTGDTQTLDLDHESEGSGPLPSVSTLNTYSYVSNRDFEIFSVANTPQSWDVDSGTVGTHILEETTGADVFRGDKALRLDGDGAQATIQISQDMTVSRLTPKKRYMLGAWIKSDLTGIDSGTLEISFAGTGYTAAGSEKVSIAPGSYSATYALSTFYLTMPAVIPDDFELVIKVTGTMTTAKSVWIDSLAFGEVSYGGGINVALIAGATRFQKGDTFTFSVTNNNTGVIQTYFRRKYGVQLPSSGTPSISDTLAT